MTPSANTMGRRLFPLALLGLAASAVLLGRGPAGPARVRADEPQTQAPKPLPALEVEADAPLLDAAPTAVPTKPGATAADNAACFVCHANYKQEALTLKHAAQGLACTACHGASEAHRNDENNITPPDVMFPLATLDGACRKCHATHDAPARAVVARFRDRVEGRGEALEGLVCTSCHGEHRLDHRTVRWDRATGKLLGGKATAAASP